MDAAAGRDRRPHNGKCKCFPIKSRRREEAAAEVAAPEGRAVVSAEEDGDDGVVRVKIVMSRRELSRLLATSMSGQCILRSASSTPPPPPPPPQPQSLEQLLHELRRGRMKRAEIGWMPALQSIPEEN